MPTVLTTGQALKTMIIFRNLTKAPKGPFPNDVVVFGTMTGVMTGDLMVKHYLPEVIIQKLNIL